MIESFNNVIKRKAKPKAEFPNEQSLDTFIGIQAMSYNDRYFNRIHKGFGQVQDTLESYFDQIKNKKSIYEKNLFTQKI
ncbi:transposase IS256 [Lactobacillus crispatus]|nr:transposase IS256 [Lactobacillus crispatus]